MNRLRSLVWLLVALLVLSACGTSGRNPRYSVTGSWQGSATNAAGETMAVEALFASDGRVHLALLGNGEHYFGTATVIDNYGQGRVTKVSPQTVGQDGVIKFVLDPGLLTGYVQAGSTRWDLRLQPTAAADGPAQLEHLPGTWSILPDRLKTYLRVEPDLKMSGSLGCIWQGNWSEIDPAWNLYGIFLHAGKCFDPAMEGTFQGLAILVATPSGNQLHALLAAPNDGHTQILDFYATVNEAPTANTGADFTRTVLPDSTGIAIVLDGSTSTDPNGDPLRYQWTALTDGVILSGADTANPSFVPPDLGVYQFQLIVSDGLLESFPATVTVTVEHVPVRFAINGDGTVTDNTTGLIWLQDANCFNGFFNADEGRLDKAPALANGQCGLNDGSVAGDWRLPSQAELRSLLDLSYVNPALSSTDGYSHWTEGDPFINVQLDRYWTATGDSNSTYDPVNDWYESYYYVDIATGNSGVNAWGSGNRVWPVRGPVPTAAAARR